MHEFDLYKLLAESAPIQEEYEKRIEVKLEEVTRIRASQEEIRSQANAQLSELEERVMEIRKELYIEAMPFLDNLKPFQQKAKSAVDEMIGTLSSELNEEEEVLVSPETLVEVVSCLPSEEPTTKFISDLLNLICVDEDGQVKEISISIATFDDSEKTRGIMTLEGETGALDIHFDFNKEEGNEMVEFCLLDDDSEEDVDEDEEESEDEAGEETEEVKDPRYEFQNWATHYPTLGKLVVLGFFADLAIKNI